MNNNIQKAATPARVALNLDSSELLYDANDSGVPAQIFS
jgi:hypothetical protein